jgi:hypothetical protein
MLTYNFAALFYQVCTVASATQAAPKGGKETFAASAKSRGQLHGAGEDITQKMMVFERGVTRRFLLQLPKAGKT